jgi:hypothetical protein
MDRRFVGYNGFAAVSGFGCGMRERQAPRSSCPHCSPFLPALSLLQEYLGSSPTAVTRYKRVLKLCVRAVDTLSAAQSGYAGSLTADGVFNSGFSLSRKHRGCLHLHRVPRRTTHAINLCGSECIQSPVIKKTPIFAVLERQDPNKAR